MTLQEILDQISLLIDHDLENSQIVTKLNQISRLLFRKLPLPDKVYKFQTTETPYYDLPTDCAEDRIRFVIIDGTEYTKVTIQEQNPPWYFCMVIVGKLYIKPNPIGKDAYLYYGPRHVELSASNLSATPSLPEDYHELLVYGAAKWIASLQRDVDLANNFESEYQELLQLAEGDLRKFGQKRVKLTTVWW